MLSTEDIAGMRATLTESLPDTCTVLIPGNGTSDGAGGQTYSPTSTGPYACRISPRLATGTGQLKDAEAIEGQRLIEQAPWMITMPAGVELSAAAQIEDGSGRKFEVFAVLEPRSWQIATRVLCRLINQGVG